MIMRARMIDRDVATGGSSTDSSQKSRHDDLSLCYNAIYWIIIRISVMIAEGSIKSCMWGEYSARCMSCTFAASLHRRSSTDAVRRRDSAAFPLLLVPAYYVRFVPASFRMPTQSHPEVKRGL